METAYRIGRKPSTERIFGLPLDNVKGGSRQNVSLDMS